MEGEHNNSSKAAPDVVDDEYVCRRWSFRPGTLRSMRARGQIPFYRLGGGRVIRYRLSELEAWFAAHAAGRREVTP